MQSNQWWLLRGINVLSIILVAVAAFLFAMGIIKHDEILISVSVIMMVTEGIIKNATDYFADEPGIARTQNGIVFLLWLLLGSAMLINYLIEGKLP